MDIGSTKPWGHESSDLGRLRTECLRVRYDLQCHLGVASKNYWDMQMLRSRTMLTFSCLGEGPFQRLPHYPWICLLSFVFGPSEETAFQEYALVDAMPFHPILPTDKGHWLRTSFRDHDWSVVSFQHENKWRLAMLHSMLREQGLEVRARNRSYCSWCYFWENRLKSFEETRLWRLFWHRIRIANGGVP